MRRTTTAEHQSFGVYILIIVVLSWIGITATFGLGRAVHSTDHTKIKSPTRPLFVHAPSPVYRAEAGLLPDATSADSGEPSPTIRTIQVFPHYVYLTEGGVIVREIALDAPLLTLPQIVTAVGDQGWIRNEAGVVTLTAGLLLEPQTTVTIEHPVSKVVLEVTDGVFLGVTEAHLTIRGVEIQASDDQVPSAGETGDSARPYVVAYQSARLDIEDSQIRFLGRDWNCSYGVSWVKGSTGTVIGSTFERNFMGGFTNEAQNLIFQRNTFRDNALFGLGPHGSTTGLVVENNVAEGNGAHGIIVSGGVNDAVVRGNTVRNNAVDGIVVYGQSNHNLIEHNLVAGNAGDGIVVTDSVGSRLIGNTVLGNWVGIHAYRGSAQTLVERNALRHNTIAGWGLSLDGNTIDSSGHGWRPAVVALIWASIIVLGAVLCWYTRACRSRLVPHCRHDQPMWPQKAGVA
ncbi:MAG: right-handed parallel beta-helix repeat-containing protein [Micromonosporaceae bacterium]|nr:right-handed parallel beta-helix repeat-containing protein [Micromonosporaceae bacterium]